MSSKIPSGDAPFAPPINAATLATLGPVTLHNDPHMSPNDVVLAMSATGLSGMKPTLVDSINHCSPTVTVDNVTANSASVENSMKKLMENALALASASSAGFNIPNKVANRERGMDMGSAC